jgi:hypothetical protein
VCAEGCERGGGIYRKNVETERKTTGGKSLFFLVDGMTRPLDVRRRDAVHLKILLAVKVRRDREVDVCSRRKREERKSQNLLHSS